VPWHQTSRSASKPLSSQNTSGRHDPRRNSQKSSSDPSKSSPSRALPPSRSASRKPFGEYIPFSMSLSWKSQLPTTTPLAISLPHLLSQSKVNSSTRSPKFLIP